MASQVGETSMKHGQRIARDRAAFAPDAKVGRGLPESLPKGGHEGGEKAMGPGDP